MKSSDDERKNEEYLEAGMNYIRIKPFEIKLDEIYEYLQRIKTSKKSSND